MGSTYQFRCTNCAYEVQVSGGGDAGMVVVVQTMTCTNCSQLGDVITHTFSPDIAEEVGRCPSCGSDLVSPWDPNKRPCPKCGSKMEIDPHGFVTLWD